MKISMIGHSTVLIETANLRILTDPYFGLRGNLAYARIRPPARQREELTGVDLVLVSHNHFDHTDHRYFRALSASVPVLAPFRAAWMTRLKGARNVVGVKPWQQRTFGDVSVTAVPAWHTTVTAGYIIQSEGRRIYFAGDTYFAPFMARIAREYSPDVALMPVTTFRVPPTMGEGGALSAVQTLTPKVVIPIHLGITPRSPLLRNSQSPEHFEKRLGQRGLHAQCVHLREGESWSAAVNDDLSLIRVPA